MKEGTIEYYLKVCCVGTIAAPEYASELTIKIRPYNEASLQGIALSLGLVDKGLVERLLEDVKGKLLSDKSQDLVASQGRQLLPEFCEEKPVVSEDPGAATSDQKDGIPEE